MGKFSDSTSDQVAEYYNLDYSDSMTMKITKVSYLGEPSHWEMEVLDATGHVVGSGTAPTYFGVVEMAIDIISNRADGEWKKFDANNKEKK